MDGLWKTNGQNNVFGCPIDGLWKIKINFWLYQRRFKENECKSNKVYDFVNSGIRCYQMYKCYGGSSFNEK